MESNATAAASSTNAEARAANKYRFELELEFVQSLANPYYLQALAQQGIMEDPSFVLYLDYLQYWSEPGYAKFVMLNEICVTNKIECFCSYPHALHHLQLLQNPKFRADLKADEVLQLLVEKQFDHWRTWRSAPIQSLPTSSLPEQNETQPVGRGGDIKLPIGGNTIANGGGQTTGNGGTSTSISTNTGAAPLARTPHPGSRRGTPRAGTGTPRVGAPGTSSSRPGSNAPTPL